LKGFIEHKASLGTYDNDVKVEMSQTPNSVRSNFLQHKKSIPLCMLSTMNPKRKMKQKQLVHTQTIGLDRPQVGLLSLFSYLSVQFFLNNNLLLSILLYQLKKRVKDVEREDALDILALLVERSLGFEKKKSCSDEKKETSSNFFSQ